MRLNSIRHLALLASAAAAVVAPTLSGAARPDASGSESMIQPVWTPLGVGGKLITVVLEMQGDPVAVQQGNAGRKLERSEREQIKAQLRAPQASLNGQIQGLGGTVLANYQSAYNGIKVRINTDRLSSLAALPGVLAVRPAWPIKPNNVHGIPLIGAPGVWQSLGIHGEGVKVGIIDTGIDYTHANFGGPGTTAAYNAAHAAETAPADPALFGPAAPRVKGGIDLVGDSYNADPNATTYPADSASGSQSARLPRSNERNRRPWLARRRNCRGVGRPVQWRDLYRPVQRHHDQRQQLDRRTGRCAEGRPLRDPGLRLRGIDRCGGRRDRMGGRQRHGRHQHVARLAIR